MQPKIEAASSLIGRALSDLDLDETTVSQATFHLTDWVSDLSAFCDLLERPENYSQDLPRVSNIIIRFLAHVPAHLREAERLLIGSLERE